MQRRQLLAFMAFTGAAGCLRLQDGDGQGGTSPSPQPSPTASPTESTPTPSAVSTPTQSPEEEAFQTEQTPREQTEPPTDEPTATPRNLDGPGSWPQTNFDAANTGYQPNFSESMEGMDLAWSFRTLAKGDVDTQPVVADGVVVLGSHDSNVYGVDFETGQTRWEFATGKTIDATAALSSGLALIGTGDSQFRAIELSSGTQRWSFRHPYDDNLKIKSIVYEGHVYLPGTFALDIEEGSVVWELDDFRRGRFAAAGGNVFVAQADSNRVAALNPADGSVDWQSRIDGRLLYDAEPVAAEGRLFVTTSSGRLFALDAGNGETLWSFDPGEIASYNPSTPAVHDGRVFYGYAPPGSDGFISSTRGAVFALDAGSGDQLWKRETDGGIGADPVVTDDSIYIGTFGGSFYSIAANDGQVRWQLAFGERIAANVLAGNGLFVLKKDGSLDAYRLRP